MEVQDKRKLLVAINTLVTRPAEATPEMVRDALIGFRALINELTGGAMDIGYIEKGESHEYQNHKHHAHQIGEK